MFFSFFLVFVVRPRQPPATSAALGSVAVGPLHMDQKFLTTSK